MAERAIQTVGVIGLGKMGRPIARHIAAKGFAVAGYDIDPAAIGRAGVASAASPAALAAASDLVLLVTAYEHQVGEALFGKDGAAAGARPGTVVAVASTIAPQAMIALGRRLAGRGLTALDAPLCRGEPAAEEGTLLVIAGGDRAAFERCRPVFAAFADAIFHLGPVGAGQVGKMVNNLILWACISANHEGLLLGERLGVDRHALREMLLESSGQNWPLETGAGDRPMPWAEKDMMIVLAEADALRLSLPLCGTVKEVVKGIKIARGER